MPANTELTKPSLFLQVALVGVPIATAMPPVLYYSGTVVYDRSSGDVFLRVGGAPPALTPAWYQINGSGASLFPLLYVVDNRYVVAPTPNGPFPTITAALTRLLADGYGPGPNGPATVMVVRGTYAESFVLPPGVSLAGESGALENNIVVQGTITYNDPLPGQPTLSTISNLQVAPLAGDCIVFNGTAAKSLALNEVTTLTPAAGSVGLRWTNTHANSLVISTVSASRPNPGTAFFAGPGTAGQYVAWKSALEGANGALHSEGVGVLAFQCLLIGPSRFANTGAQLSGCNAVAGGMSFGPGDYTLQDCSVDAGGAGSSPVTMEPGTNLTLAGSIKLVCTNSGTNVLIAGTGGTIYGTPHLEGTDGDVIAAPITWASYNATPGATGNTANLQPRLTFRVTGDLPANPYPLSGLVQRVLILPGPTATQTIQLRDPSLLPDGFQFTIKNLDPAHPHNVSVAAPATINNGLQPNTLPMAADFGFSLAVARNEASWIIED